MDKRVGHGPFGRDAENSPGDRGVVDLADARVKIRSRVRPTTESLTRELDEIRSLLDQGLSTEAKARLALLIANARSHQSVLALARCALSVALEQQGHYRDVEVDSARSRGERRGKSGSYLCCLVARLSHDQRVPDCA